MAQDGEIDLSAVKARYSVKDIILVDSREIDFVNEYRLSYEISFAIGLTLLGCVISNFDWILLITTLIFLLFGFVNLGRFLIKQKQMKTKDVTASTSPSASLSKKLVSRE